MAVLTGLLDRNRGEDTGAVAVCLVDVSSARRRRVWSDVGGASAESTVSWSPDGHLIAVTYLGRYDDEDREPWDWLTIVLDREGSTICRFPFCAVPPSPNTAWTSGRELITFDAETWQLCIADVHAHTHKLVAWHDGIPLGVVGGRLIAGGELCLNQPFELLDQGFETPDVHTFLTIHPGQAVHRLDVATDIR